MLKSQLDSRGCQTLNGGDKIFHLVLSKKVGGLCYYQYSNQILILCNTNEFKVKKTEIKI